MGEVTMEDIFVAIKELAGDVDKMGGDINEISKDLNEVKVRVGNIETEMKDMKTELKQDIRKLDLKFTIVLEELHEAKTDIRVLQRASH